MCKYIKKISISVKTIKESIDLLFAFWPACVKVSFDAAIDRGTAILSTMLGELGASRRITEEQIPHEDGTYSFGVEEAPSPYKVISRGWLNAQNRSCLWRKERIVPGEMYHYEIDMVPTDYLFSVLETGRRLGSRPGAGAQYS